MKKIFLSLFLIVFFGAYVFYRRFGVDNIIYINSGNREPHQQPIAGSPSPSGMPYATPSLTPKISSIPTRTPVPTAPPPQPSNLGQYKNGQYVGSVADAYYGNVQVKVYVQNGRISDVQFLQYPSDRSTSRYINSQAMPYLTQEAIQAQSANVNTVSGATATSGAFRESLASALSQALN